MEKEQVFNLPIPQATSSYVPVTHQEMDELVHEELDKRGFEVVRENILCTGKGQVAVGTYDIKGKNSDFGHRIAWQNSYNKVKPVAFVSGTQVFICANGLIMGDMKFVRRHTGSVKHELVERVQETFIGLEAQLQESVEFAERCKMVKIDPTATAELCGRLLMEHEIITTSQLSTIRQEFKNPTFGDAFDPGTFWELYNHTTYALKENHPVTFLEKHRKLQEFAETQVLV